MVERFIHEILTDEKFGRQMRFIAGPRQVGKTTLAKKILESKGCPALYYNWDNQSIRSKYRMNADFFLEDVKKLRKRSKIWLCFDEIHKVHKWKNILKAFFDEHEQKIYALITGSARLDLFRRSGDSLTGRYFLFHLLPIALSELRSAKLPFSFTQNVNDFLDNRIYPSANGADVDTFKIIYEFSGFPEPLLKQDSVFHKLWQREYLETIVYEDLRDISQIKDLESVARLIEILPMTVGTPLSIQSLTRELEINFATVKNYLHYLDLCYLTFSLSPYSKKIMRSIKKSKKLYFYDWTRITDNPAARFENFIACQLKSLVSAWRDYGLCDADLYYLRTEDGKETDFLIVINRKPWLLIEAKYSSNVIEKHHYRHSKELGRVPILQLTYSGGNLVKKSDNAHIIPAEKFFL